MNRVICPAILLVIHLGFGTGAAASDKQAAWMPDRVVAYKTVENEKGKFPLQLHIFNPAGQDAGGKRPCVVLFHGGGWVSGEPAKCYTQRSKEHSELIETRQQEFLASLGYCETEAGGKNPESNPATR